MMSTYSIQMMQADLNNEYRFLKEIEDAFQIVSDLGYDRSGDPEDYARYCEIARKLGDQKHKIYHLERTMLESAR